MREFWLPYWRGVVPDEIFRGGLLHQLPAQCDLRSGRDPDDAAVCAAKGRSGAFPDFQRERPEAGAWIRPILRPRRGGAQGGAPGIAWPVPSRSGAEDDTSQLRLHPVATSIERWHLTEDAWRLPL